MIEQSINEKPVLTKDELKYKKEIQRMENEGGYVPPPPNEGIVQKLKLVLLRIWRALKHIFEDPSQPPENPPSN